MNQTSPEFTAASTTQGNSDGESDKEKKTEKVNKSSVLHFSNSDISNKMHPQKGK